MAWDVKVVSLIDDARNRPAEAAEAGPRPQVSVDGFSKVMFLTSTKTCNLNLVSYISNKSSVRYNRNSMNQLVKT